MNHPPEYTTRRAMLIDTARTRAGLTVTAPRDSQPATASAWNYTRHDPAKGSPSLIAETTADDPYQALAALCAKLQKNSPRATVDAVALSTAGTARPLNSDNAPDLDAAPMRVVLTVVTDRDDAVAVSQLHFDKAPPMIDTAATGQIVTALRATLAALPAHHRYTK